MYDYTNKVRQVMFRIGQLICSLLLLFPGIAHTAWQQEQDETQRYLNTQIEGMSATEKYSLATKYAERAVKSSLAEHLQPSPLTAISYCELGEAYTRTSAYREALPHLDKGFGVFSRIPQAKLRELNAIQMQYLLSCMHNLGTTLMQTGQVDRRIEWYKKWLAAVQNNEAKNTTVEADVLLGLSAGYAVKGNLGDALALQLRGLKIYETTGSTASATYVLAKIDLANIYSRQGNPVAAISTLEEAAAALKPYKKTKEIEYALGMKELGSKYIVIGQFVKGLEYLNEAAPLIEKHFGRKSPYYIDLQKFVTIANWSLTKNHAEALESYIYLTNDLSNTLGPDHPAVASLLMLEGIVYLAQNNPTAALNRFNKSESIVANKLGDDHTMIGMLISLKGAAKAMNGSDEDAILYANNALGMNEANRGISNPVKALGYFLAAYAYKNAGQNDVAIVLLKNAVNIYQSERDDLGALGIEAQIAQASKLAKIYQALADLLIESNRYEEAQVVLDMMKADELYQYTSRSGTYAPRGATIALSPQEQKAFNTYSALISEISELNAKKDSLQKSKPLGYQPRISQITLEIAGLNKRISDNIISELRNDFKDAGKQRFADKKTLNSYTSGSKTSLIKELGDDVALLQYYISNDKLGILITTKFGVTARTQNIPFSDLNKRVMDFYNELRSPNSSPLSASKGLYKILIEPIRSEIDKVGAKTVMLSLDGSLRYIPFGALHDGSKYLVEQWALPVFTVATQNNLRQQHKGTYRIAGFGVTQPWGQLEALPSVQKELNGIVKTGGGSIPGDLFVDQKFTADKLKSIHNSQYSLLHIASHFVFSPGTEANSFLLLGDGAQLSLEEIRKKNYRFDGADLLTLSACETARGGGYNKEGREIEGFGVIAQNQGANSVLATLWKVSDESTAIYMADMYHLRSKGLSKIESVRKAQINLMATPKYAHPYFWAPFILMGNWQ